ncbi:MAG: ribose 5-phosphate isomerase B [Proteobacteria bacterium]|nr:ribose 5-phosphate isomerase B [Pseudomonadota bacterium]
MRIAVGSDHAGFMTKETLKERLVKDGHEVRDFGTSSPDSCDYPDYARLVAQAVAEGAAERGLLVCGSGIGMCMAANRFPSVRAAVLHDDFDAEMSRRHNDANVACLAARKQDQAAQARLLEIFLKTPFDGGRHEARVAKIDQKS